MMVSLPLGRSSTEEGAGAGGRRTRVPERECRRIPRLRGDRGQRALLLGYNWAGQLGDGALSQRNQPKLVLGGRLFRQISAGTANSCGTTLRNVAFCWGAGSRRTPVPVGDRTERRPAQ